MNDLDRFKGVVVPMVSPLTEDFSIDEVAVNNIVTSFIENKVFPLVLGTTGEVASLSPEQKIKLVKVAVKEVNGRIPVLAGICNNSIFAAIEEGKKYVEMGVEAVVVLVPNYYPMADSHVKKWLVQLAEKMPVPMFLYNIPATTHHSVSLDVIEELSHHPNVIGIKDSEQNQSRLEESLERWSTREDFLFLVGWAAMSSYGLRRGADGIVPSVGNLIPDLYANLYNASKKGDWKETERFQSLTNKISAYNQSGRTVTEAIPALKVLMNIKGICGKQVMPPMLRMAKIEEQAYKEEMNERIMNLMR